MNLFIGGPGIRKGRAWTRTPTVLLGVRLRHTHHTNAGG